MKRHQDFYACFTQSAQYLAILVDRLSVRFSRPRLDACPFDRHPVGRQPETFLQGDVLAVAMPSVACDIGSVAVLGSCRTLGKDIPIARRTTAFDLRCGRRGAEQKGPRQGERAFARSDHSEAPSLRSMASRWARTSGSLDRSASTLRTALMTVV